MILKQLCKSSAVSAREKGTQLTVLKDLLCWVLYRCDAVCTAVPLGNCYPAYEAEAQTDLPGVASGWAPVWLCLQLTVRFINENWEEFLMIRIVWRCKRSSFQSELWKIWLLDFLHFKLLTLKAGRIKVVSSPVSSQYSQIVHGV